MTESAVRARSRKAEVLLAPVAAEEVTIFKIRNRSGYAAICMGNLCEGKSPEEAFARLLHPLRRMGYALPGRPPAAQQRA